jgi:hypothetical protein
MSVELEPCGIERPNQRRTFGLKVRNTSSSPIDGLSAAFEWENERHQPNPDGSRTAAGGTLLRALHGLSGPLAPGDERVFYIDERYLEEEVMGRIAALSSERYWVAVRSGEQELARYPGNLVGGVLEGLGLA